MKKTGKKTTEKKDLVVDVMDRKGAKKGKEKLPLEIFGIKLTPSTVYKVYNAARNNTRGVCASTKTRAQVKGSSRKPWRQKGTGRARHGTIKSPIWRGGGITFGPLGERNYKQKITGAEKKAALKMVLSQKVREGKLLLCEEFGEMKKTKEAQAFLKKVFDNLRKVTLIIEDSIDNYTGFQNIKDVNTVKTSIFNIIDLLNFEYIFLDKKALKVLINRLSK